MKRKVSINRDPAIVFLSEKAICEFVLSVTYGQILLSVQNWSKIAENKRTTWDILI